MSQIESMLDRMRPRPGMYIGFPCLRRLAMYLEGYASALDDIGSEPYAAFLAAFREWIYAKFGLQNREWSDIIIDNSPNERAAFDRFWELLDEFRSHRTGTNGTVGVSAADPSAVG
jgi:hypothetical protein